MSNDSCIDLISICKSLMGDDDLTDNVKGIINNLHKEKEGIITHEMVSHDDQYKILFVRDTRGRLLTKIVFIDMKISSITNKEYSDDGETIHRYCYFHMPSNPQSPYDIYAIIEIVSDKNPTNILEISVKQKNDELEVEQKEHNNCYITESGEIKRRLPYKLVR